LSKEVRVGTWIFTNPSGATNWERLSIEQLRSADRLLFGRVTYEGMAAYWETATGEVADFMNSLAKVVVSRTLERAGWSNTKLVRENIAAEIPALKHSGEGNTLVFGSANLSSTLMQHDLFDEYRIAIVPVVLGHGKPLFAPDSSPLNMKLLDSRCPTATSFFATNRTQSNVPARWWWS
jgi:dihydrofolate reductase